MPFTTWYAKIAAASSAVRFASAEPMDWKASLFGAKMVRSGVSFATAIESVALSAPRKAVRFAALAVSRTETGRVRTVSMTWITPPVKLTS